MPTVQIRYFALEQGVLRAHAESDSFWVNFQIGELEERLAAVRFFRARRGVLVNLEHVRDKALFQKRTFAGDEQCAGVGDRRQRASGGRTADACARALIDIGKGTLKA